ncbi:hypothetical protein G7046_g3476 [Stylonectria norvegica]|nr:hypothetical protein G7046_g3476 [Stylonectria norvegica]
MAAEEDARHWLPSVNSPTDSPGQTPTQRGNDAPFSTLNNAYGDDDYVPDADDANDSADESPSCVSDVEDEGMDNEEAVAGDAAFTATQSEQQLARTLLPKNHIYSNNFDNLAAWFVKGKETVNGVTKHRTPWDAVTVKRLAIIELHYRYRVYLEGDDLAPNTPEDIATNFHAAMAYVQDEFDKYNKGSRANEFAVASCGLARHLKAQLQKAVMARGNGGYALDGRVRKHYTAYKPSRSEIMALKWLSPLNSLLPTVSGYLDMLGWDYLKWPTDRPPYVDDTEASRASVSNPAEIQPPSDTVQSLSDKVQSLSDRFSIVEQVLDTTKSSLEVADNESKEYFQKSTERIQAVENHVEVIENHVEIIEKESESHNRKLAAVSADVARIEEKASTSSARIEEIVTKRSKPVKAGKNMVEQTQGVPAAQKETLVIQKPTSLVVQKETPAVHMPAPAVHKPAPAVQEKAPLSEFGSCLQLQFQPQHSRSQQKHLDCSQSLIHHCRAPSGKRPAELTAAKPPAQKKQRTTLEPVGPVSTQDPPRTSETTKPISAQEKQHLAAAAGRSPVLRKRHCEKSYAEEYSSGESS